jgi:hypothetical protein
VSLLLSHFDFFAVVADSVLVLRNLGPQRARNRALREARMSNLPRDLSSPWDAVFARLFGVMLARVWCSRGWWWSGESWNSRARKLVCVVVFFSLFSVTDLVTCVWFLVLFCGLWNSIGLFLSFWIFFFRILNPVPSTRQASCYLIRLEAF